MKNLLIVLATVAIVVIISLHFTESRKCDKRCMKFGCNKKGCCVKGCKPFWMYRKKNCRCAPRCGGNCVYCASYYMCHNCRRGYCIKKLANGRQVCRKSGCGGGSNNGGCDPHCTVTSTCAVAGTCDATCEAPYFKSPSSVCEACPSACTECSTATTCTACDSSAVIDSGVCAACDPNCGVDVGCTVAGQCDGTCASNYVFVSPTCSACDPNCGGTCNTPGFCDTAAGTASTCAPGYGPNPANMCDACQVSPFCTGASPCPKAGQCASTDCDGYTYDDTGTSPTYTCV